MKKLLTTATVFVLLLASLLVLNGCQKPNTDTETNPPKDVQTQTPTETKTPTTLPNTITIKNFSFVPQILDINAGDEVTWINEDAPPHTVVTIKGEVKSDPLKQGASFKYKFDQAGKYEYVCSLHPAMTGVINVK